MNNKVYSIELTQYYRGGLYNREHYDVKAPTAEVAIRKAKTLAKQGNGFFKSKPINVETLKQIVSDLR